MQIIDKDFSLSGKFIKTLHLSQEWYEDVPDPPKYIAQLSKVRPKPDLFTFWQRLPEISPKYNYFMEMDNIAAVPIVNFEHWLKNQINSNARRAVKKAKKLGVTVKIAEYDDEFINGMTDIFNETPIRQGRPFWHYGKSFEQVKKEFSKYLFREDLVGAYHENELIGFIMLAYAGNYALTGQIISKIKHRDKYPNNALIAKAIEICSNKNIPYLVYLKWDNGSLTEFKRRNGFEKISLPRYYVPITIKGRIALKLNLHHGLLRALPPKWKGYLKEVRSKYYSLKTSHK